MPMPYGNDSGRSRPGPASTPRGSSRSSRSTSREDRERDRDRLRALGREQNRRARERGAPGAGSPERRRPRRSEAQENWDTAIRIGPGAKRYHGPALMGPGSDTMSIQDLMRRLVQGAGQGGPSAQALNIAEMIRGGAGAAPSINIDASLAPYAQARETLLRNLSSGQGVLAEVAAGRDNDRRLFEAARQADLDRMQREQAAAGSQLQDQVGRDVAYGQGDLAAQGIDPSLVATVGAGNEAGVGDTLQAQKDALAAQMASSDRDAALLASMDNTASSDAQAGLRSTYDQNLMGLNTAEAQARSELEMQQAQLQAEYAQQANQANIEAAMFLAEQGGETDPTALWQAAAGMLGELPNGGRDFTAQRDELSQDLADWERQRPGSPSADIFRQVASQADSYEDFMVGLEETLAALDDQRSEAGKKDHVWDRDLFSQWAQRYFAPSDRIRSSDADAVLQMLLGPQAATGRSGGGQQITAEDLMRMLGGA